MSDLDELERLAHRALALQSVDPLQDKCDLARALLDVLPVVRAAEAWRNEYGTSRQGSCNDGRCQLAKAVDTLRTRLKEQP